MLKLHHLLVIIIATACSSEHSTKTKLNYLRWIGDIEFDSTLDNPDFELCHGESSVNQYFNFEQGLQYEGEKKSIIDEFDNKYQPIQSNESGLIRIRFIVNCKGETDRFRILTMDKYFDEKEFDPRIINQLLRITKGLNGWKILPNTEEARDYYQYLIFKIEAGNIVEILP